MLKIYQKLYLFRKQTTKIMESVEGTLPFFYKISFNLDIKCIFKVPKFGIWVRICCNVCRTEPRASVTEFAPD